MRPSFQRPGSDAKSIARYWDRYLRSDAGEYVFEIGDLIVGILDPDREAAPSAQSLPSFRVIQLRSFHKRLEPGRALVGT